MKRVRQSRDRRRLRRTTRTTRRRRSTERKRKSLRARKRLRFVKFAAQVAPHPRPERRRRGALIRKITQYKASPAFARIESSSTTRIHQEKKVVVLVAASPRRARTSSSNPPLVDVDAAIARIARGDARPTCAHPFPSARAHSRRNARRAPTVELIPAATESLAPARLLASLARVRPALARARSTARASFARIVRAFGRASTRARVVETCARISEATRQCAPDRRSRTRDATVARRAREGPGLD